MRPESEIADGGVAHNPNWSSSCVVVVSDGSSVMSFVCGSDKPWWLIAGSNSVRLQGFLRTA